ncbi:MAG TPA: hypothetical protein DCZ92_12385 [Elusimicrobia bacterium]|nr:hypothetical protein [Elusimicrobiota bacterium]
MKNLVLPALICSSLLLTGCGLFKQKAAAHYLEKAAAAAQKQNLSPAEADAAFAQIDKAVSYDPGSYRTVEVLEELAAAAAAGGYAKAQDLEAAALRKILAQADTNWAAQAAMLNIMSARGDLSGLADAALAAGKLTSGKNKPDPKTRYCALLTELAATALAAPRLESEAYLNVNRSPRDLFEKTAIYSSAVAQAADLKAEAEKLAAADPSLKQAAPAGLVSLAGDAASVALKDTEEIARAADFTAKAESNRAFKTAVVLTVQGNAALLAKDFEKARLFYQGALSQYPALIDARRQLAETDFQEGASLAAGGQSKKAADVLLTRAYGGVNSVIQDSVSTPNRMPFMTHAAFLGETYALKAAAISAMKGVEGDKKKKTALAKLELEFKTALDNALKLCPECRLARELFDYYTKEGF